MNETTCAGWTPSPHLRWSYDMAGPPVLQQLMTRDGYEAVWSPIPGFRQPHGATGLPGVFQQEGAEALAKKIVSHLMGVGTDKTFGTPTRLAFKYKDASGQECEGGGLGEHSLIREIRRAIQTEP